MDRIMPGDTVIHFKNELGRSDCFYRVLNYAINAEDGQKVVVYQALYEPYQFFIRTMDNFFTEVDIKKYPYIKQKFRFEKV